MSVIYTIGWGIGVVLYTLVMTFSLGYWNKYAQITGEKNASSFIFVMSMLWPFQVITAPFIATYFIGQKVAKAWVKK
jgi:hypothetical protein